METKQPKKKLSLAVKIFIALFLGVFAGLIFTWIDSRSGTTVMQDIAQHYIKPFGVIFINLLKFIVVPIVVTSIIGGVVSLKDISKIGKVGGLTLIYFVLTTVIAVVVGLGLANFGKQWFTVLSDDKRPAADALEGMNISTDSSLMDTLVNVFPSNFFQPMVASDMLQVIVIALFIGFAIIKVGKKAEMVGRAVDSLQEVFMQIMIWIISISPYAVFCLIIPVVAENGAAVLGSLAILVLIGYAGYIVHAILCFAPAVKLFAGLSPMKFFKEEMPAALFAFSSSSSVATLPISMECVEKMGGRRDVSSFVLPLCATINMNGTAIYQAVCSIFIATSYGIDLTLGQMVTIVVTAVLASIGTAGAPGSGLIMLALVLQSVGLPLDGIALVAAVDRLFDMGRTAINVMGDAACAVIVSKFEDRHQKNDGQQCLSV